MSDTTTNCRKQLETPLADIRIIVPLHSTAKASNIIRITCDIIDEHDKTK